MSINDEKLRFTAVYEQESDSLFRFCLLRVSDREKALELTQETFTRLWSTMAGGKRVENPRAFAFLTARRLIIDWYRRIKESSLDALTDKDDDKYFEPMDEHSFLEIESSAEAKRVLNMINKLEPNYREAVYLRYIESLTPKEIGSILKISANAASIRVNRGLEALRAMLHIDND